MEKADSRRGAMLRSMNESRSCWIVLPSCCLVVWGDIGYDDTPAGVGILVSMAGLEDFLITRRRR